ncbi:phospholipid scramblase 1-like [Maniola hyperantus]|uniref:phospholipid scramblase 1-like n=1 Tax=Aphantopus hyperantus TaxID=2795564 RepID=UPI00156A1D98|nr:phospholipid scramblase 1-like [Maniola hyperantus]
MSMKNTTINGVKREEWMPCPKVHVDYPGLAYLYSLDEFILVKKTDKLHDLIGLRSKDTSYTIINNQGQKVFLAVQKGKNKFEIRIYNVYGNELIIVNKPYSWCLNKALIWAPPGNFVGSVQETKSCLKTYIVKNHLGEKVLKLIKARGFTKDEAYNVFSQNEVVGLVTTRWRNAVYFPIEMDIPIKCILLGACFLICWKNQRFL